MMTSIAHQTAPATTKRMRAARLHVPGEPLVIEDVRVPPVVDSDVLVDVFACGVTPTLEAVASGLHRVVTAPLPTILGSGACGIVSAIGPRTRGVRVGDRVFVDPVLACGTCRLCLRGRRLACESRGMMGTFGYRDSARALLGRYLGGFAERVLAPAASCIPIPASLPFTEAPRLAYLATSLEAVRTAKIDQGDEVVVLGATGALGAACVFFALAAGARRVLAMSGSARRLVDLSAYTGSRVVPIARGALDAKEMLASHAPSGIDVVLDAQGLFSTANDLRAAIDHLRGGGRAVFLGGVTEPLAIDYLHVLRRGLHVAGSWMASRATIERLFEPTTRVSLPAASIARFPLQRATEAIQKAAERTSSLAITRSVLVEP